MCFCYRIIGFSKFAVWPVGCLYMLTLMVTCPWIPPPARGQLEQAPTLSCKRSPGRCSRLWSCGSVQLFSYTYQNVAFMEKSLEEISPVFSPQILVQKFPKESRQSKYILETSAMNRWDQNRTVCNEQKSENAKSLCSQNRCRPGAIVRCRVAQP